MVLVKLNVMSQNVMEENVIKDMHAHANVMGENVGKKDVAQQHAMEETAVLILLHLMDVFHLLVLEQLLLRDLDQLQVLGHQK